MMQFHPGARVSFDSPRDERLSGTVMKFNRKTLTVVTDNGQRWNISPHLLFADQRCTGGDGGRYQATENEVTPPRMASAPAWFDFTSDLTR
jgi:hypothetical protein